MADRLAARDSYVRDVGAAVPRRRPPQDLRLDERVLFAEREESLARQRLGAQRGLGPLRTLTWLWREGRRALGQCVLGAGASLLPQQASASYAMGVAAQNAQSWEP